MALELPAADAATANLRWQQLPLVRLGMLSWFGLSACMGAAPLYPRITASVGTTTATLGLLITMSSVVSALLQVPCGLLADRGWTRGLTMLGLALPVTALLLWAAATNVVGLAAGWLAFGIAVPALQSGSLTAILQEVAVGVRGAAMSRIWAASSAGSAAALVLFGVVGDRAGWRVALVVGASMPAAALLAVSRSPKRPVAAVARRALPGGSALRFVVQAPVRQVAAVATLAAGAAVSIPVVASFALRDHAVGTSTASVVLVAFILGGVVGAPIVGASADRWGPAKPLLLVFAATTVLLTAIACRWAGTLAFAVCLGLAGAAVNGALAVSQGLAASRAEDVGNVGVGTVLAGLRLLQSIGAAVTPGLSGFLLERGDAAAELAVAGLLGAAAGVATFLGSGRLAGTGEKRGNDVASVDHIGLRCEPVPQGGTAFRHCERDADGRVE